MGQFLIGAASKDQMAIYYQVKNVISATSRYSQDILDEVLYTKKWWNKLYWGLQTN